MKPSERGAMLVMVAIALLGLTLLSGIVVDSGIMWTAHGQAQNVADATALAGGWARVLYDTSNPPLSKTSGVIWDQAEAIAARHTVWNVVPPASSVILDWTCPDGTTKCVVVDVFRDGTHGSQMLPVSFMQLAGITNQRARAHAIAWLTGANSTGCLRPWFLIDHYTDVDHNGRYNSPPDLYAAPGYTDQQIGQTVTFDNNTSPSGFGTVDVGTGQNDVEDAIKYCANGSFHIGQIIPTEPGGAGHPKEVAANEVIGWDTGAHWDGQEIIGSCAPSCNCGGLTCPNAGTGMSPRVFVAAVCAPTEADCALGGPSNGTVTVTNLLSFFLESATAHGNDIEIIARFIGAAGNMDPGGGVSPSPFLQTVILIR